jgi:hypothetical protein
MKADTPQLPDASPMRKLFDFLKKKPMDEWSVEEWRAFIQGKTTLE